MIVKKYISLFIWPKSNCFNAFELHDKILFCHFNFKSNAYTSICLIKLSFDRSTPFSRFSDDYLHHVVFCFKVNNWLNNLHVKHNCFSSYPCVAAKANKIGKKMSQVSEIFYDVQTLYSIDQMTRYILVLDHRHRISYQYSSELFFTSQI